MSDTTQASQTPTFVGPGNIVHTEWASNDVDASRAFLSKLFGWEMKDMGNPQQGAYWTFGDDKLGLGGAVRAVVPEDPGPSATPYVSVDDLDATIAAATEAGATVMVPKMPVEKMGWFAWFQAPGDIVVAAWQNDESAPAPTMP